MSGAVTGAGLRDVNLKQIANSLILGVERSCEETAASVVERGSRTLSSVAALQIANYARYGVVPERASREHLRAIVPVVETALKERQRHPF